MWLQSYEIFIVWGFQIQIDLVEDQRLNIFCYEITLIFQTFLHESIDLLNNERSEWTLN